MLCTLHLNAFVFSFAFDHIFTFCNQAVSFDCTYYRKINVKPKKLPPSKAKVKCTLCSLVFCNKLYFLKNHWGKTHQRSKLDPDWIYVDKRTKETVWEKKAPTNFQTLKT